MHILTEAEMDGADNADIAHALLREIHNQWGDASISYPPPQDQIISVAQVHAILALRAALIETNQKEQ